MGVELRPMRDDEFAAWAPRMRDEYARAMIDEGGFPAAGAAEKAAADLERLFPDGLPASEQLVFVLEADGDAVGELWLAEREDMGQRILFVYDIHVAEAHRGRGHGKAAMLLAEEEARRRGVERVALNVFGRNTTARSLYRSLGYEENAVAMSKSLAAD
ncbi:MAG TPA: GNAT family N-acetyltransferase [Gaiellaceae bacterium]|nr:GNAT family N-acetyltransferase [Gaiellaceae bacterium]